MTYQQTARMAASHQRMLNTRMDQTGLLSTPEDRVRYSPCSGYNVLGTSGGSMLHQQMPTSPSSEDRMGNNGQSLPEFSVFAFSEPELEALFKTYYAQRQNTWALLTSAMALLGYLLFIYKVLVVPREGEDDAQLFLWSEMLLVCAVSSVITLMLFKPTFYRIHRQALNTGVNVCSIIAYPASRMTLLWMKALGGKTHSETWLAELKTFAVENLFIATSWMNVVSFPSGPVPDLVLMTLYLFRALVSNASLCTSPYGSSLVTMRPAYLATARRASMLLAGIAAPLVGGHASDPVLSCPAALGVWEVVGWLVACLLVLVADILRRRAFLRTGEAQAYIGQEYAASAMRWPFASSQKSQRCVMVLLVLLYGSSLLWNTAFQFVSIS
eukprot:jgi/Botrbrau1/15665/Bobra.4_1s0049.1